VNVIDSASQYLCCIATFQNTRTNHYNLSSNEISHLPSVTIITLVMRLPFCRSPHLPTDLFRPWSCLSNGPHYRVITTHVCTVEVAFLLSLWKFCRSSCRAIWKCKKIVFIFNVKPSTQYKNLYVEYSRDCITISQGSLSINTDNSLVSSHQPPTIPFPIHYLLIILSFDATQSGLLTRVVKLTINKIN
jgi:hypothetical protein